MPLIIINMLICIVVAVFALQNSAVVPVKFMFFEEEASLVLVILFSVFLGVMLGATVIMYVKFKHFLDGRKKNEQMKTLTDENLLLSQKINALEKELDMLNAKNAEPAKEEAPKEEVPVENNVETKQ